MFEECERERIPPQFLPEHNAGDYQNISSYEPDPAQWQKTYAFSKENHSS